MEQSDETATISRQLYGELVCLTHEKELQWIQQGPAETGKRLVNTGTWCLTKAWQGLPLYVFFRTPTRTREHRTRMDTGAVFIMGSHGFTTVLLNPSTFVGCGHTILLIQLSNYLEHCIIPCWSIIPEKAKGSHRWDPVCSPSKQRYQHCGRSKACSPLVSSGPWNDSILD